MTTIPIRLLPSIAAAALLASACGSVRADGLADLHAALARLPGTTPLRASVEAHSWRRTGQDKDGEEHQGTVSIGLEDGPRGLTPVYGRDLLSRSDSELRAAMKDKKATKPIEQTLQRLGVAELCAIASTAPAISRELGEATFLSEAAETREGKPVRRLSFESGIDTLSEGDRKYAKEFRSVLTIWIGADGVPVASNRHLDLSGRAFVVVSFEMHEDENRVFTVVGDRLVSLHDDEKSSSRGAGESQDYRIERRLQVQL